MEESAVSTSKLQRIVLGATILGSSMAFLDGTVVNLALPVLQKTFGANVSTVQWVVEAYALTLASLLLVGGSMGDRYGRRKVYVSGVLLFALSSIACGLSPNAGWLIVARAVQGVGGALLVPGSLALITANFPEDQRGRAIGTWSGFSAITAAIGPVAGGWLLEHFSWRWVFFLNVPVAIAVIALCAGVPEARDENATGSLDWPGALLMAAGLSGVTYTLIEWPSSQHPMSLLLCALAGLLAIVALIVVERRAEAPMLPLDVFRSRNFTGANLLTFLVYAPLGALLFFTPLDLIQIQHYSATEAGAAFSPFVVIMLVLSRWAGHLVERYGARLPLTVGPLITTGGYVLFAVAAQDGHYWSSFFPAVLTISLGMTVTVAPLTTTVMNAVPMHHAGVASGINNAVSRLASLLAVAAFGALLVTVFTRTLDHQLVSLRLPLQELSEIQASRLQLAAIRTPEPQADHAIAESFIRAYRMVLWVASGSIFLGALAGWLIVTPVPDKLDHADTSVRNDG